MLRPGGFLRRAGLGPGRVDVSQHLVLGQRLRSGGRRAFGWNIGYGFGDTSAASENMLFYGGKAHKLSRVCFHIPQRDGRDDFLSPWRFTSDDGRFEMKFDPILDRAACTDVKLIKSDQHQVFGRFTGAATLDDGRVIQVRDMLALPKRLRTSGKRDKKHPYPPGYGCFSLSKILFDRLKGIFKTSIKVLKMR